jgi:hypothetical protein
VTRRRLQGQEQPQDELQLGFDAEVSQQGRRKLQAAVTGPIKTVNVVDSHETCENIRVLVVDAVPVPCNFAALVTQYDLIQSRLDSIFVRRDFMSLDAAYYDWLLRNGIIKPGETISQVTGPGGVKSAGAGNSAAGAGMTGLQRQLQTWVGVVLLMWFSWQFMV